MKDVTNLLSDSKSKIIQRCIGSGGSILGIKIPEFYGVLIEDKEFANDLAKRVEEKFGVRGYISTDELPAYGISKKEKEEIERAFDVKGEDVVILVATEREKGEDALRFIVNEIEEYKVIR
ncbi:MAG: GAD domain-containing protein [Candidatus Hydrothermarchaeota archaeon]